MSTEVMEVIDLYNKAKQFVEENHQDDIEWSKSKTALEIEDLTKEYLFKEIVFGILVSGFRYQTVVKMMPSFAKITKDFDVDWIASQTGDDFNSLCKEMRSVLNNGKKILAIARSAIMLSEMDFEDYKAQLKYDIDRLKAFPYIGETLKYQVARNIGFDVCKPDIHIRRIAEKYSYDDPIEMCVSISQESGDTLHMVDTVLWRYCERGNSIDE